MSSQPMRERRARFSEPGYVDTLILEGSERVREEAVATLREMQHAMGFTGVRNRLRRAAERRERTIGRQHASRQSPSCMLEVSNDVIP